MLRNRCAVALIVLGLLGCKGGDQGTVRGRVVENGQPVTIDGQAALMFYLLDEAGRPMPSRAYPIPLEPDGTFQLVASGGAVPPGKYMVTLDVNAPKAESGLGRFRDRFVYPDSPLRQEVAAGTNYVNLELAPQGT